jgi:hypothetical protein
LQAILETMPGAATVRRGDVFSLAGYGRLLGLRAEGAGAASAAQMAAYRLALFETGNEASQDPAKDRAGLAAELVAEVRQACGAGLPAVLRSRIPAFSRVQAVGGPGFLATLAGLGRPAEPGATGTRAKTATDGPPPGA